MRTLITIFITAFLTTSVQAKWQVSSHFDEQNIETRILFTNVIDTNDKSSQVVYGDAQVALICSPDGPGVIIKDKAINTKGKSTGMAIAANAKFSSLPFFISGSSAIIRGEPASKLIKSFTKAEVASLAYHKDSPIYTIETTTIRRELRNFVIMCGAREIRNMKKS